ncbi:MAG: exosortase/archaeosortase family protein, partial [Aureliella sp.]
MSQRKHKKKTGVPLRRSAEREPAARPEPQEAAPPVSPRAVAGWLIALSAVLIPLTLWAYWPTFVWMEDQWRNEPDYSHGYLILPLALLILYHRRDLFPGMSANVGWAGFGLLLGAIGLRVLGRMAYMDFLDGWTLVLWIAGLVWIFGGWPMLRWALPSIAFLLLLVPLPYQAESLLSWRLQGLATALSVGVLQTLGFPAIAEGHTIWLEDNQMLVEE